MTPGRVLHLLRRCVPVALIAVGSVLLLMTATARLTLLNRDFDTNVVAHTDAYERLYTEVLPSPGAQRLLSQALAGVPVDVTYLTANVRLLLPPDVLERVTSQALGAYVDYLLGDTSSIDLLEVLQPVVDHIVKLVRSLLPELIAHGKPVRITGLAAFQNSLQSLLTQISDGQADLTIPTLPVPPQLQGPVTAVLIAGLKGEDRRVVSEQVTALLRDGDLNGALTVVVQNYVENDPQLITTVSGAFGDVARAAQRPIVSPAEWERGLRLGRRLLPLGQTALVVGGTFLLLLGLGLLLRRPGRRLLHLTAAFGTSSLLAVGAGWCVGNFAPDPLAQLADRADLPLAAQVLVQDLDRQLRTDVTHTYVRLVGVVLAIAVLAASAGLAQRFHRGAQRTGAMSGLGIALMGVLGLTASSLPPAYATATCNSSRELCDRAYNQVSFLTSHNAMSSSDEGFVSAYQDPDVVQQLDNGVRALMLDLHYWTSPEKVNEYLATLPEASRAALKPLTGSLAPRPGVWLCHAVCQFGARSAVPELRRILGWMQAHRDAVVTLIIEDHTSESDTRAALKESGLLDLAATPPRGGQPWATLGGMVRTGRRLVVFTERAAPVDGPIRSFYAYAAETPYEARSVSALTCDRGRGPQTAPLFLLNNWISTAAPSRAQASRVNASEVLYRRALQCQRERGMRPNFVATDFSEIGRPLAAVNRLNSVR